MRTIQHDQRDKRVRRSLLALALALVVGALAAGCGGEALQSGIAPDPAWLDVVDATAAVDAVDATAAVDAVDATAAVDAVDATTRAEEQVFAAWLTSRVQLQDPTPFGSSWAEQTTTTLALVRVRWHGDVGERWVQPCALHTTPSFGSKLSYPSAFLAAVPVEAAEIRRDGAGWSQADVVEHVGMTGDGTADMPKNGEAKHPALVDHDGDGKPGVTLGVEIPLFGAQKLYVAQRTVTAWSGEVDADGVVSAEPTITSEQATVGATLDLLLTTPKQKPVASGPAHTLRWHPLSTPIGCATLVAESKTHVGQTWPP